MTENTCNCHSGKKCNKGNCLAIIISVIALIAALVALCCAMCCHKQQPQMPMIPHYMMMEQPMHHMKKEKCPFAKDMNKKHISKEERFDLLDTNKDGTISKEEFVAKHERNDKTAEVKKVNNIIPIKDGINE